MQTMFAEALDDCPKLSADYRQKAYALRDYYYPIEIDPTRTRDEKLPLMVKWWSQSHDLMEQLGLDKSDISDIVKGSKLRLRYGWPVFFFLMVRDVGGGGGARSS